MIFQKTHEQVTSGRKTQTRRLMIPYPRSLPARRPPRLRQMPAPVKWPRKVTAYGRDWRALSYAPGVSRAVQPGRGKAAIARVRVTDIRHEILGGISHGDAKAEGFRTADDFKIAWVTIHDGAWAWVESDKGKELRDREELRERFTARHSERPVWVVTFELVRDDDRLLRAGMGAEGSDEGDYTYNAKDAMKDEPEPVHPAMLAAFSQRAEVHRKIGHGRAAEIQAELDQIQASIDRLLARSDVGRDNAKRLADMRRHKSALERSLAA